MASKVDSKRTAGAFDIRTIIATLFALYGVVLVAVGAAATSSEDLAKAAGVNINLWSGIGMLLFAGGFAIWVWLRPIVVEGEHQEKTATE